MARYTLKVNGEDRPVDVDPSTPLLWVLRDHLKLTGAKYGCGIGACGSCTVHVGGEAVRSCTLPVEAVGDAVVLTVEGLPGGDAHPVIAAWTEVEVPQCGYCQPGMVMAAAALLAANPSPTAADVREGITNLCRCGTYHRVLAGVLRAAALAKQGAKT